MNGLAPQDKRFMREAIVSNFFSRVGDKQVQHLDEFMERAEVCNFSYKGVNYHNSFTTGGNFRQLEPRMVEEFEGFLKMYETLDVEMASLSALLTRLFRYCNSLADLKAVLPGFLHQYTCTPVEPQADDAHMIYITDKEIEELHKANEEAVNLAKIRAMRDQVFS